MPPTRPDRDPQRAHLRATIPERYIDFQEIGRGGMGLVYLALDTELNRRVALKVVRPDRAEPAGDDGSGPLSLTPPAPDTPASEAFRTLTTRFLQEAWVTGGLEHPGIVPVYELGQTPRGVPFYTMKFVRGERTLERAINEAATLEERLGLLEPFLKVCDTMSFAHAKGVIHRDLKPANIILGEFGEVLLLDWGLARIADGPDPEDTVWRGRIRELRDSEGLRTQPGAMGTPGFMPPESLLGGPRDVDERSDVYSLGAILYRILAGRMPHEFESIPEMVRKLREEDPRPPHEVDAAVPERLSRVCIRALARDPDDRTPSTRDLAGAIRDWKQESAVDREVENLLRDARLAWSMAETLIGEAQLRQLDQVLGRAGRVLELRPEDADAGAIRERAERTRTLAMAERERASRRRLLQRVSIVGLVLALLASGGVGWLLEQRRQDARAAEARASRERDRAAEERDAKQRALAQVLRLADVKRVRDLHTRADELWPIHPDQTEAMEAWIKDVEEVVANRELHETTLDAMRERGPGEARDEDRAEAWQREVLEDLVAGLATLVDGEHSSRAGVRARLAMANELERISVTDRRVAWDRAIVAASDQTANPIYRGLKLEPVTGLVPIGADPESGLLELAHVGSGSIPRRDPETGRLVLRDDTAIVLVLIPGGTFSMGAQRLFALLPNYDSMANKDEGMAREVTVPAFLIAKYECTQAQWAALTGGERPSLYPSGRGACGRRVTERNPVEQVSWDAASRWLGRHRLRLPSEAEWEYACRAGTKTPWITGWNIADLGKVANISDAYLLQHGGPVGWKVTAEVNDGQGVHAPVGTYQPNPFGLYDMHGNIAEWCADWYAPYFGAPTDGSPVTRPGTMPMRVTRGGSWHHTGRLCRSSDRGYDAPDAGDPSIGFRPAATLPRVR